MEDGAVLDAVTMLGVERWDAILIQEGPAPGKSGCSIIDGGHAFFFSRSEEKGRTACILLHRCWGDRKYSFCALGSRLAYVDLDIDSCMVRLTTSHLPDSAVHDEVLEAAKRRY